ncbi:MAG: ABC transporter ATP-binding protein [Candidatus Excrementavichristensenella sp.]|jgi:ATP-binding cassette subfamily B multidrug efflux pump
MKKYLGAYKKESILGPLFKLTECLFELMIPLVVAAIIDRGIVGGDRGLILRLGLLMVGLGLVGLACSLTAQYYAAKAAVGAATAMRQDLFDKVQSLSYTQLDRLGASGLITRMTSDVQQVQSGINLTLRLFLRSPFVVFGAMVMAFRVDPKSALVFVAAIPLLALVVFAVMLFTMPMHKRAREMLDKVTGKTRENLSGARVVRAFAREEGEIKAFGERNQALTGLLMKAGRLTALTGPLTSVIVNAALMALLYIGALRVGAGYITQGAVIALVNYMSQILIELIKLANLIVTMTRSLACWGRVRQVLDLPVERDSGKEREPLGEEAVSFEDVGLTYPDAGAAALTDISFRAYRGMTVGVIGGTGSGKSSLVNLIPGFYPATRGQVRVLGRAVREWDPEALRGRIGLVPQRAQLFQGSIRENLCFGNENASDGDLLWALEAAQALDFVGKAGLDHLLEPGGRNLSGGQRQRLTIARALVRRPDILILDDSASALDYATEAALRKSLGQLRAHCTTFIVSQRSASVTHADLILVLDDGRLAGSGTHEELMGSCPLYREIYYSQYPEEAAP